MRMLLTALVVALLSSVACSHDIDALKAREQGAGGAASLRGTGGRSPISGSKDAGAGGRVAQTDSGIKPDAGNASSGSGGSGGADRCLPCDALTAEAKDLGLTTCCGGTLNGQCGLRSPITDECLPLLVPGMPSTTCLPVAGAGLAGCCRPDTRCGVDATDLGLGCVEPHQVTSDANASDGTNCNGEFACATDTDCKGANNDSVCAVRSFAAAGACIDQCKRDADCLSDQVCTPIPDFARMRLVAGCARPIGAAKPGEDCVRSLDCDHNLCRLDDKGPPGVCTLLCSNTTDCPAQLPQCSPTVFPDPVMSGKDFFFQICKPPL